MAFQMSPGVNVSEIDLTTVVPATGTTEGAFAGNFAWGPIDQVVTVENEIRLVEKFWKPDTNTAVDFFTAANFLSYANNLKLVRAASSNTKNATAGGSGLQIKNDVAYETNYINGEGSFGPWAARYAGALGNSIRVSVCPDANAYTRVIGTSVQATAAAGQNVVRTFDDVTPVMNVGDFVSFDNGVTYYQIATLSDDDVGAAGGTITLTTNLVTSVSISTNITVKWQYADQFEGPPGTSPFVTARGGSNDELHVIVIDEDGDITGVKGTVIEKYGFVSKAVDARGEDGSTLYYPRVIFNKSKWVYWGDHPTGATNWTNAQSTTAFTLINKPETVSLSGGTIAAATDADRIMAYDKFKNTEEIDISLVLGGAASATLATYLINNIAEYRKDCIVLLSPEFADVVNNVGDEVTDILAFRNTLPSSSYAVMDSGWKYQFDKYNDLYRWVPLNGDIAGLCVRTDVQRDPWFSPAGGNRGQIKNVVRLAWNPTKTQRDELYRKGVNPVVSFPGEGTLLYGDKTLLSRTSAFDRINVRRLFIVLEKTITAASKSALFEFNDEFTRAQFVGIVEPFLREVKGRRGIFDYRVVCNSTNNTPEIIDRNEFVGDIYIKPSRSINFVQLNFVAVRTGVAFEEIVGQF